MKTTANAKKKKSKWIVIGILVGIIVVSLSAYSINKKNSIENKYDKVTAIKGNIETFYTFSGNVQSKNSQIVMAQNMMQIKEIKVSKGDKVKTDDILFTTTDGTNIKSKINGTVSKIYIKEDQAVMSGIQLCEIYDFDNLQVNINVDEYDLSCLELNKEIDVTIGAIDKTIKGTVSEISDTAVSQNGVAYFTSIIDLEQNSEIKVGMTAEAKKTNMKVDDVLTLSMKALQFDEEDNPYVYIMPENSKKNSSPVKIDIEVGINNGKTIQIINGLKEGQTVLYPKQSSNNKFMPPMSRT